VGDRRGVPRAGERPGAAHRGGGRKARPGHAGLARRAPVAAPRPATGVRSGGGAGIASEGRRMGEEGGSRRGGWLALGGAVNAIAAALLAVPLLGFILSPARRWSWQKWVPLGAVADFPENQTRLATYRNPFSRPWDGDTANIPCWVRRIAGDQFQVF